VIRDGYEPATFRKVNDSGQVFSFLQKYYAGHDREEMTALMLDAKNGIIGFHTIAIGSLTLAIIHPRETFKAAILLNASAVLLAHNHPSGDPTPSQEDRELTRRLVEAGKLLGIQVMDHLVIGHDRYISFGDQGWL